MSTCVESPGKGRGGERRCRYVCVVAAVAHITANDAGVVNSLGSLVRPSHLTTHEPLIKLFVKLLDQVRTRRLRLFSLTLYLCSCASD